MGVPIHAVVQDVKDAIVYLCELDHDLHVRWLSLFQVSIN